jgi:hypothetical protein
VRDEEEKLNRRRIHESIYFKKQAYCLIFECIIKEDVFLKDQKLI